MSGIKILKTIENDYGWECTVQVNDDNSSTEHLVTIPLTTYSRLTGEQYPVEQLVTKSFEFLLKKEPKESILSEFTLDVIGDYFSDWEQEIVK